MEDALKALARDVQTFNAKAGTPRESKIARLHAQMLRHVVGDRRAPVRHERRRTFAPLRPCSLQFPRSLRLCGFGGVHLGILPAFVDRVRPRGGETLVGHELLQAY